MGGSIDGRGGGIKMDRDACDTFADIRMKEGVRKFEKWKEMKIHMDCFIKVQLIPAHLPQACMFFWISFTGYCFMHGEPSGGFFPQRRPEHRYWLDCRWAWDRQTTPRSLQRQRHRSSNQFLKCCHSRLSLLPSWPMHKQNLPSLNNEFWRLTNNKMRLSRALGIQILIFMHRVFMYP